MKKSSNTEKSLRVSIAALVVSCIAAVFCGLQWYEAYKQRIDAAFPLLDFLTNPDGVDSRVGLAVKNTGQVPVVISSIKYFCDHVEIQSSESCKSADLSNGTDLSDGSSIAPGELIWLTFHNVKGTARKDLDQFQDVVYDHLVVKVQYCSTNKIWCQTKCSADRCD
ncbi:MAG: hypothetical protein JO126_08950 [Alphaproteobacteria bacterium]|nr:hypothetical protein [Alphaproteobacteria bacterium]